jgi:hypothetical protein
MFTYAITNRSGAKLKKKMETAGLHVMFALRKDERKLQYSRSNILGFINTRYFTSDNVPDGFKNATHNTFSNFRKKLAPKGEFIRSNFGSLILDHFHLL